MILEFTTFGVIFSGTIMFATTYYTKKWINYYKIKKKYISFLPKYNAQDKEKIICSICLNKIQINDYIRKLPCEHIFHSNCIDKWIIYENKNECPNCRKQVY